MGSIIPRSSNNPLTIIHYHHPVFFKQFNGSTSHRLGLSSRRWEPRESCPWPERTQEWLACWPFFGDENSPNVSIYDGQCQWVWGTHQFLMRNEGHRSAVFCLPISWDVMGFHPPTTGTTSPIAGVSCYQLAEVFAGFPFLQQANAPANPATGQPIGTPWYHAEHRDTRGLMIGAQWVDGFKDVLMAWWKRGLTHFKTTQSRLACEKHCASMSIDGTANFCLDQQYEQCCKALRMPRQSQMWWQRLAPAPWWEEDEINPAVVFPCQPACQWTDGWNWQLIWTAIFNSRALLFSWILYEICMNLLENAQKAQN